MSGMWKANYNDTGWERLLIFPEVIVSNREMIPIMDYIRMKYSSMRGDWEVLVVGRDIRVFQGSKIHLYRWQEESP